MPHALTELLVAHRRAGTTLAALSPDLVPASLAEARAIQNEIVAALGGVGAWKVAPVAAGRIPACSPIPGRSVHQDGAALRRADYPGLGIEVELAVTISRDLPARPGGYAPSDIQPAIGSFHIALEIVASSYGEPDKVPELARGADLQNSGAVVVGPPVTLTPLPEFGQQYMSVAFDGVEIKATEGNATTENVLASLAWLADHAASRGLPLKAGDVVITGARLGVLPLTGRSVVADGLALGRVSASFD